MYAKVVILLFCVVSAGCSANYKSVHRPLNIDNAEGALIDIKQRAIIVSRHVTEDLKGKTINKKTIICAEPSPDSLSAYAAQIAGEGQVPEKLSLQLAAGSQESAAFVGLRTQSIQLLRDSLYRLCEGYMSGALTEEKYDLLMRRYQKYMVALLSIEQLTGAVRAPSVTINTQSSASAAQSISTLREQIKSIDTKISDIDGKITSEQEKKPANGMSDEQKNVFENEKEKTIKKLKSEKSVLEKDKNIINKAIENARGLATSGSATANVNTAGIFNQRSDQHIKSVAKAVENITTKIIDTDDTGQLCWAYISSNNNTDEDVKKLCKKYIENINKKNEIKLKARDKLFSASTGELKLTTKQIKDLKIISEEFDDNGLKLLWLPPNEENGDKSNIQ